MGTTGLTLEGSYSSIRAVGVVLPVHNEEQRLHHALEAIGRASTRLPGDMQFMTVIVLDACNDNSRHIAHQWAKDGRTLIVPSAAGNVGAARRTGCQAILRTWHRLDSSAIWLATTDADSQVPEDWLVAQIDARSHGADMWTGRVDVADWSVHRRSTSMRWANEYQAEVAPIHGASMGLTAQAYHQAGGFEALASGEDRALYLSVRATGAQVHHDQLVKVMTSARRDARAPLGFAHALTLVEMAERRRGPILV